MTNQPSSTQSTDLAEELSEELYSGLLTLDQTRTALRVSRYTLTKMLKAGELTTVKVGARVFVSKGALTAYINAVHGDSANGTSPS